MRKTHRLDRGFAPLPFDRFAFSVPCYRIVKSLILYITFQENGGLRNKTGWLILPLFNQVDFFCIENSRGLIPHLIKHACTYGRNLHLDITNQGLDPGFDFSWIEFI